MSNDAGFGISRVLLKSLGAGLLIGAVQGLVGYFPKVNTPWMMAAAGLAGALAAGVFGVAVYAMAFRANFAAAFRAIVLTCLIFGTCATIILRWWTRGEGGDLSFFVIPVIAVISSVAVWIYMTASTNNGVSEQSSSSAV